MIRVNIVNPEHPLKAVVPPLTSKERKWDENLSAHELKQKAQYWDQISAYRQEFARKSQKDVLTALYMTSGLFSPARKLLLADFDPEKLDKETLKRIFDAEDDSCLIKGQNLLTKNPQAVVERQQFLGIS